MNSANTLGTIHKQFVSSEFNFDSSSNAVLQISNPILNMELALKG